MQNIISIAEVACGLSHYEGSAGFVRLWCTNQMNLVREEIMFQMQSGFGIANMIRLHIFRFSPPTNNDQIIRSDTHNSDYLMCNTTEKMISENMYIMSNCSRFSQSDSPSMRAIWQRARCSGTGTRLGFSH